MGLMLAIVAHAADEEVSRSQSFASLQHLPLEAIYRMASILSRISVFRGRPPDLAGGTRGCNNSHSLSVKSLG